MKQKIGVIVTGLALVIGVAGCGNSAGVRPESGAGVSIDTNSTATTVNTAAGNEEYMSEEEAKKIVLAHAGIDEAEAEFIRVQLDREIGTLVYEIEFYSQNTEYDYEIDAYTGEVIGFDKDIEGYEITADGQRGQAAEEGISEEQAKQIALDKVPGAGDSDIRIHKDYDDGKAVYEGSIIYNEQEYEFEINAINGTVIEWSVESIYD